MTPATNSSNRCCPGKFRHICYISVFHLASVLMASSVSQPPLAFTAHQCYVIIMLDGIEGNCLYVYTYALMSRAVLHYKRVTQVGPPITQYSIREYVSFSSTMHILICGYQVRTQPCSRDACHSMWPIAKSDLTYASTVLGEDNCSIVLVSSSRIEQCRTMLPRNVVLSPSTPSWLEIWRYLAGDSRDSCFALDGTLPAEFHIPVPLRANEKSSVDQGH